MKPAGVFVLIDALGWRLLEGSDFLSQLLSHRHRVRTVLGFSSGAIPTILTGSFPAQTGHWNLYYYDPAGSPFRWLSCLRFLPDSCLNLRISRKLIAETGRRVLGLGPLFECQVSPRLLPYFNFLEKRSIYRLGGITGAKTIFDRMAERRIPYRAYTYLDGTDSELVERALGDLRRGAASFYFVYLSELDAFLHLHCEDRVALRSKLADYAGRVESLFSEALGANPEANLAVFSDHGMTPVRHRADFVTEINALGLRMPEDYLAVYDSTMARFWFFRNETRQAVTRVLSQLRCGRILDDAELRRLGIFFADRRYGELIFLLHPGWLLASSDFHRGGWRPAGMHGYHPDDPDSDAVFLSNRPPSAPVKDLTDVHRELQAAGAGGTA